MPKTLAQLIVDAQQRLSPIYPLELKNWLVSRTDIMLIDIREPDEFYQAHLPDAWSIPRGLIEAAADRDYSGHHQQLSRAYNQPVVLIGDCPTSARAVLAGVSLQTMGFSSVYYLAGGLQLWIAEDLLTVSGPNPEMEYDRHSQQTCLVITTTDPIPSKRTIE